MPPGLLEVQAEAAEAVKAFLGMDVRPPSIDFNFDPKDKKIPYHWHLTDKHGYKIQPTQARRILNIIESQRGQETWTTIELIEILNLIVNKGLVPVFNDAITTFHIDSIPFSHNKKDSSSFGHHPNTEQITQQPQSLMAGLSYQHSQDGNIEEIINHLIQFASEIGNRSIGYIKAKAGQIPEPEGKEIYQFLRDTMIGLGRGLEELRTNYNAHIPPMLVTENRMNVTVEKIRKDWEKDSDRLLNEVDRRESALTDLCEELRHKEEDLARIRARTSKLESQVHRLKHIINVTHKSVFNKVDERQDAMPVANWTKDMCVDLLDSVCAILHGLRDESEKTLKSKQAREA
ncbi:hypothetical protein Dda_0663 [Drechslerella dactyloides]|uniref:Uncharacterized protein n=1 Tax=Drechslerella dactyloides TaxID=74499 RepID=A0AAD6J5M1_DREDA|nr:hypothetical protein Dda_0663 [Drechslerella dactyloides]